MPFIRMTTSAQLDNDTEKNLRQSLGTAVEKFLGKDPARMMTAFEGGMHMRRGLEEKKDAPVAFVECKFFGGENFDSFKQFDAFVKESISSNTGIAPEDLYIKYEVIKGWEQPAKIFKI